MGEIHKLTKDGKTLFPATTTDAVAHPQTRTALSNLIHEFNVSELFPKTEGYTLESAINILNSKSINITQGTKVMFLDEDNNFQEWVFSGSEPTNTSSWFRLDSWYTETEDYTDDLEANLITDALRKTEQNLSDAEVTQVKKNLKIPEAVVKVTWAELKVLKENSKLVPGQYYRIYNFKTTTGQENTKSANHQFDIIIEALTENELIEEAKVCQHEGDTYFSNTALEAWEIKYCLENDTNRFAWANNSGYGVIYYMKDEFNNEAWYDFKNIMFLRNTDWLNSHKSKYAALSSFSSNTWFYTFSLVKNGNIIDDSLGKVNGTTYYASDNHLGRSTASITKLNNTIFISNVSSKGASNSPFGNIVADGHRDNTLGHSSWVNIIGHNFSENIIGDQFQYNRISENFSKNHIAPRFTYNTIESGCVDNRFSGSVNKCNIKQGYSSNNATGNLSNCNFGSGLTWISDMPGMNNIEIIDNTFSGDSNNIVLLFNLSNTEGSNLGNILSYENYINKLVVFKTNNSYGTLQLDNLLESIYNLGDFSDSKGGEDAALNSDISTNQNITVLKYTTQGRNATIIQQVDNLKTTQYLYWSDKKYKRVINFINIPGAGISVNGLPYWQEEYFLTTNEANNILFKTERTVTNGSYTDNANCYGYFGTLKNLGLNGNVITVNSISVYRRSGSDNNADVSVWCRLLRRINGGWEKLAQSETSRKFNEVEQNGELVFKMIMEENITPLSSIDEVAIVFVNNSEADVNSCNGTLGFKVLAGKGALTGEISSNSESISVNNTYTPAININYQFLYVDDTVLHSDKDETITGNKTFKSIIKANNGILINEKAFISASIDPGELKVLYKDSNNGFIIRTKDDEDDIHRLELLATNGSASHTYTFPEKSGTVILSNDIASVDNLGLVKIDSDYTKITEGTALSLEGAKNLNEAIDEKIKLLNNKIEQKHDDLKVQTLEEIFYSDLVTKRNNGELIPGQKYRITDYVTTTAQKDTTSAGYQFDIIVEALSENVLNETASACLHEGDTYFENSNLEAWELKYCLDNDTSRFAWAKDKKTIIDSTNVTIQKSLVTENIFDTPFLPEYYIYIDTTGNKNNEYTNDDFGTRGNDYFIEWGRETTPDGLENQLCIYKNDLSNEDYIEGGVEEGTDYEDKFFYWGTEVVDGITYDKWRKYEIDNSSWNINSGEVVYILTPQITNGEVIEEDEELHGKGVIYYMKDEYGNECPYDFKNIQFYNNTNNTFFYTFSWVNENNEIEDLTLRQDLKSDDETPYGTYGNTIKPYYNVGPVQQLNNIIFVSNHSYDGGVFYGCNNNSFGNNCYDNSFGNNCNSNSFENECYNNIFGDNFCDNSFGNNCYDNNFGNECYNNSFGTNCNNNSFGNECYNNSFGTNCTYNSFRNECRSNSFEDNCSSNIFGNNCYKNSFVNECHNNRFRDNCYANSFGNICYANSFGNDCHANSFGNECTSNIFGDNCYDNSFGNGCYKNSFGNNCYGNSFGNGCYKNSFGDNCHNNSFENNCTYNIFRNGCYNNSFRNYCSSNSFVNGCSSNSFGNDCHYNSFGNYCSSNSFGNSCKYNSFRDAPEYSYDNNNRYIPEGELLDYFNNNHFSDGCNNIIFWCDPTNEDNKIQNLNISQGFGSIEIDDNGSNIPEVLHLTTFSQDYEIKIARNSKGEVKIYCEADLIQ